MAERKSLRAAHVNQRGESGVIMTKERNKPLERGLVKAQP